MKWMKWDEMTWVFDGQTTRPNQISDVPTWLTASPPAAWVTAAFLNSTSVDLPWNKTILVLGTGYPFSAAFCASVRNSLSRFYQGQCINDSIPTERDGQTNKHAGKISNQSNKRLTGSSWAMFLADSVACSWMASVSKWTSGRPKAEEMQPIVNEIELIEVIEVIERKKEMVWKIERWTKWRIELKWIELNWIELNWIELNWNELKRNEMNWNEMNWIELNWNET